MHARVAPFRVGPVMRWPPTMQTYPRYLACVGAKERYLAFCYIHFMAFVVNTLYMLDSWLTNVLSLWMLFIFVSIPRNWISNSIDCVHQM